jgi:phage gp29-like protein
MCKCCVDEGYMTQAELDACLAAGDVTVQAMADQSPEEFAKALDAMMDEDIARGTDPLVAVIVAALVTQEYQRARAELN